MHRIAGELAATADAPHGERDGELNPLRNRRGRHDARADDASNDAGEGQCIGSVGAVAQVGPAASSGVSTQAPLLEHPVRVTAAKPAAQASRPRRRGAPREQHFEVVCQAFLVIVAVHRFLRVGPWWAQRKRRCRWVPIATWRWFSQWTAGAARLDCEIGRCADFSAGPEPRRCVLSRRARSLAHRTLSLSHGGVF